MSVPELPEVETTVRGLRTVLDGARITSIVAYRADLRWPLPPDLGQRLTGATVTRLGRRAKYGLIDTDRGDTLVFHLGMSGRWRVDPREIGRHDHVVIGTEAGRTLSLHDPRRFGSLDLTQTASLLDYRPFVGLGPEPLEELDAAYFLRALAGRIAPVKAMLLDQRIVAGLGNIYVCEALNLARISPRRVAGQIGATRLARLVEAIRTVLEAAIAAGGSTLRDYARPDGELGYFAKQWRVYGREGERCPCGGGVVKRFAQGGRSTFWCPACQR